MIKKFFLNNWQRKLVAILTAVTIWLYVSHSITETKTIRSVPIRLINLPPEKTAIGLLSNGMMNRRINLTLLGTKEAIAELEPGDLEVVLDASQAPADDWVIHIAKKNLLSLNPSLNLLHSIMSISHPEFVIKLSPLIRAKIPITIPEPIGSPPEGYEFIDAWPQQLWQEVSGPKEEVHKLQSEGLILQLDLSQITKEELDAVSMTKEGVEDNEIYYIVPKRQKVVTIPFCGGAIETINDPWAQQLHLNFLRKEPLLLEQKVPLRLFFPVTVLDQLNPASYFLAIKGPVGQLQAMTVWDKPLYVRDVSKLFLKVVHDYIEISIEATGSDPLFTWGFDVIGAHALENKYVKLAMQALLTGENVFMEEGSVKKQKELLRQRFRDYLQKMRLYETPQKPLAIGIKILNNEIELSSE